MNLKIRKIIKLAAVCGVLFTVNATSVYAGPELISESQMLSSFQATILAESVNVKTELKGSEVLTEALQGATFQVSGKTEDGWISVEIGGETGYLPMDSNISVTGPEGADLPVLEKTAAQLSEEKRQNLVNFAVQFIGGPYRYGGNDPRTGVDCSGFTRYVVQNGAGVPMQRSASSQATQGRAISADQMRPGDLIFYSSGSRINHVALYIGNGQVVHASTPETGIKTSPWNYRTPVKIVNVMGD